MAIARTHPTLRTRFVQSHSGPVSIYTGDGWTRPPAVRSYTERYRGTEYASKAEPAPKSSEPAISDGRLFVIVSLAGTLAVIGGAITLLA